MKPFNIFSEKPNVTQFILKFYHLIFIVSFFIGCGSNSGDFDGSSDSLREQAIQELRLNLHTQSKWVKVHAAEYLIWLGYPEEVQDVFMEEQRQYGDEAPYRIGIWRVLAQATNEPKEKKKWVDKILQAFQNTDGTDRVHASETLAKLQIPLLIEVPELTKKILEGEKNSLFIYTLWGASISPSDSLQRNRRTFLDILDSDQHNELFRMRAAYALRHLGDLRTEEWHQLAQIALSESDKSEAQVYLLSAALFTSPKDSVQSNTYLNIRKKLFLAKSSPHKADRMELIAALSEKGRTEDLPILISLFNNEDPISSNLTKENNININDLQNSDIRAAAAYAILKILEE